jgi:2-amino-4-hydroxy-6-hydroxymethyldihydropteridine diphosphokinase
VRPLREWRIFSNRLSCPKIPREVIMPTVFIGIGSNLGEREENCLRAIRLIEEDNRIMVTKRSSIIETEPWGVTDQPRFINMVIEAATGLTPPELLTLLKKIESDLGRTPGPRWGSRTLDLDILFYDDLVISTPELTIPHREICNRPFVLKSLEELAPDKKHPVLGKSIREISALSRQNS